MSTVVQRLKNTIGRLMDFNEDILEEFIVNISDSENDDDQANESVNEGFLDGDSTTFSLRSELPSSSDEVGKKH